MRQDGEQQQGHNIGDLDRRIDGRTGSILIGVADSIAGHRGFMSIRTLEMLHAILIDKAIFKALLGIVPSAAARSHRNGDKQTIDDHAQQHGTQSRKARGLGSGNPIDTEIDNEGR